MSKQKKMEGKPCLVCEEDRLRGARDFVGENQKISEDPKAGVDTNNISTLVRMIWFVPTYGEFDRILGIRMEKFKIAYRISDK